MWSYRHLLCDKSLRDSLRQWYIHTVIFFSCSNMYHLRCCLSPQFLKHRSIVGASYCLLFLGSTAALSSQSKNTSLDEEPPIDDTTKPPQRQNDPFDIMKRWIDGNVEALDIQRDNMKDNTPSLVDDLVGWAANKLASIPDKDNTNDRGEGFLSAVKGFTGLVTGTGKCTHTIALTDNNGGTSNEHLISPRRIQGKSNAKSHPTGKIVIWECTWRYSGFTKLQRNFGSPTTRYGCLEQIV